MTIKNIYYNFVKYLFLLKQLVSRDFKVKYKRSVLGIVWSVLYPLLQMAVMALVFSQMFRFSMEGTNYVIYLMTGIVIFQFFSDATNQAMSSIVSNFTLIRKIYIPKYLFPLSKSLFAGINFLLTLVPLILLVIISIWGENPCYINWYYLLLPYIFLMLLFFAIGIGFILSAISVFLRDMLYIYGIILTIWQYFTPIFWNIAILPANYQLFFKLNPLYHFLNSTRMIVLYSSSPSWISLLICGVLGIGTLFIGSLIFRKNQDKFIYYS